MVVAARSLTALARLRWIAKDSYCSYCATTSYHHRSLARSPSRSIRELRTL